MALVLSTCSGVYQELQRQPLDNFLMQVHCPISLRALKLEDLRVKDDDTPLQPGEFRDVDAPGGSLRGGLNAFTL